MRLIEVGDYKPPVVVEFDFDEAKRLMSWLKGRVGSETTEKELLWDLFRVLNEAVSYS